MKIAIDARRLLQEDDPTWPYLLNSFLTALQEVDRVNEYTLFFNFFRRKYEDILKRYSFNGNIQTRTLRVPHRIFEFMFEDLHVPIDSILGRHDIVHSPVYASFSNRSGRSVVTVHDLIFLRRTDGVSPEWVKFAKKNTDHAMKKADAIITISEFCKKEIMDVYGISGDRIRVIHNGVGRDFFPRKDGADETRTKYGIRGKYILYVGALEPRKNLTTLIQAFHDLRQALRKDHTLVMAGVRRYGSEEVFKKISDLRLESDVIFTGRVQSEDLPLLYSGAELFVFPSLLEGFGMPLLEAMACGAPVIASNFTSIPEVTGDAAMLVDTRSAEKMTEAIEAVLSDHDLREGLRQKGQQRARLFSWDRNARETVALYRELSA